jgi:hypothetical protein
VLAQILQSQYQKYLKYLKCSPIHAASGEDVHREQTHHAPVLYSLAPPGRRRMPAFHTFSFVGKKEKGMRRRRRPRKDGAECAGQRTSQFVEFPQWNRPQICGKHPVMNSHRYSQALITQTKLITSLAQTVPKLCHFCAKNKNFQRGRTNPTKTQPFPHRKEGGKAFPLMILLLILIQAAGPFLVR